MKLNSKSFVVLAAFLLLVFAAIPSHTLAAETSAPSKTGTRSTVQELSFDADAIGAAPANWTAAETKGKGTLATWNVADSTSPSLGKKIVTITKNPNAGGTFSLLIADKASARDLMLQIRLKPLAGEEDQGGGPIWRVQDANNYYITRWNPLENDLRLYYVKDGKRVQLAATEIKADPKAWHMIEVNHIGSRIVVSFDGKKALQADDSTITAAGKTGYWIKADGRSSFSKMLLVNFAQRQ